MRGVVVMIVLAVIVGLTGWVTGPPALFVSLVLGVIATTWYLCSAEVLIVTPDRVDYRRTTPLGSQQVIAPRTALLAVRLERTAGREVRTFAVELVLSHSGLPPAVRLYESLENDHALTVANQVGAHLSAALVAAA